MDDFFERGAEQPFQKNHPQIMQCEIFYSDGNSLSIRAATEQR